LRAQRAQPAAARHSEKKQPMSTALARNLSRTDAMKVASNLKSQIRNAALDKEKFSRRLSALAFGGASAGAMGYYYGTLAKKATDEATAGTDADPRNIGPVPIPLLVGGVLSGIGLFVGGVTKSKKMAWLNDAVESAGSHIVGGFIFQKAYEEGQKSA
jgi:hypothetical protein